MKIVIIGASGTVGRAVTDELSRRHEVIRVGRTQGDEQVDITSQASVQALFEKIGQVDAIVSASGGLYFGPLATMKDSDFNQGLQDKLLGQVRLAIMETNGQISVYYYSDDEVRPGLCILPDMLIERFRTVPEPGEYACVRCSHVVAMQPGDRQLCPRCANPEWTKVSRAKRIT